MHFNFNTLQFEDINEGLSKSAIIGSDRDITWGELGETVDRICNTLKELKAPKGHPVIIYGHKETLFPMAMLACIKMQIPYVPVDMVMPFERIKHIKNITGAEVIICCNNNLPPLDFNVVINHTLTYTINHMPSFSELIWHPEDPVIYTMFTSGSTGVPKGVMISTSAVISFINWLDRDFGFSSETVFMDQASFSFDISLIETYYTFAKGTTTILCDIEAIKNGNTFLNKIELHKCSVWVSTPSFVYMYLTEPSFVHDRLPALSTFLLLGEVLPARTVRFLHERFPGCRVLNSYGPTEATVATTLVDIAPNLCEKYSSSLPIGFPKDDGAILIQNDSNNPEEEGEIIIVGDHVSVGYLKNNVLTKEKFFTHNGLRAYRTGDYGYYKDGMLFFTGRRDDQVKLNGFRIELGEITTKIIGIDIVEDAATIALKSGGQVKKIVSFVKLKSNNKKPEADLKNELFEQLNKQLPSYMLPSDVLFINSFPTNVNHKIDKLKLLEMYSLR